MTVKFTFGGRTGSQRKSILVTSSDRPNHPVALVLRVHIQEPVSLAPGLVFWMMGEVNTPKSVQITATPERPVNITGVSSNNPRVTATFQTVKTGEQYTVSVEPKDTSAPEAAEILVATDFPQHAPRTYKIYARIK